jgi:hypothetical protein
MYRANNISSIILLILLAVLFIVLPSVVQESYMSPTQSGKTIFFLTGILFILPVGVIVFITKKFTDISGLSWLDLAAAAWFSYIIANSFLKGAHLSLSMAEFTTFEKIPIDISILELNLLATAHASETGSSTCSVDCGDGTSVSLTCTYECRASTAMKGVRCYDENMNLIEEEYC